MKLATKYYLFAVIIAVVICTGLFFVIRSNFNTKQKAVPQKATELKYENILKPEDHAPIIPPSDIIQKGTAIHVPILMYHHVGYLPANPDKTRKDLTVSPEEFESQVSWLAKSGYTAVSLNDLYQYSQKNKPDWPKKPVIFTFDDGYSDVFENAVPILNKYKFTGTFGIITGFVGQTQGDNIYASWTQIADSKASGMELVCHTQNHFDGSNPKFNDSYIFDNLSGCQQDLQTHIGASEPYLIYPYGHYTAGYITQAQKVGFVMGLTVHGGSTTYSGDLMHIPRVRVHPNEALDKFIERLNE